MSALDRAEIDRALALDATWAERTREAWLAMMALAVFGDLKAPRIGGVPRLRKKALDCGERLRAALAGRAWIRSRASASRTRSPRRSRCATRWTSWRRPRASSTAARTARRSAPR